MTCRSSQVRSFAVSVRPATPSAREAMLHLLLASTCSKTCSTGWADAGRHHAVEILALVAHSQPLELMTLLGDTLVALAVAPLLMVMHHRPRGWPASWVLLFVAESRTFALQAFWEQLGSRSWCSIMILHHAVWALAAARRPERSTRWHTLVRPSQASMADHTCRHVGNDAEGEAPGQETPHFHRWELVQSAMHELAARSAVMRLRSERSGSTLRGSCASHGALRCSPTPLTPP